MDVYLHQIDLHTRLNRTPNIKRINDKQRRREEKKKNLNRTEIGFHCELFLTFVALQLGSFVSFGCSVTFSLARCSTTISAYKVMRSVHNIYANAILFCCSLCRVLVSKWDTLGECMHSIESTLENTPGWFRYGSCLYVARNILLSSTRSSVSRRNCLTSKYLSVCVCGYDSKLCFEL